MDHRAVLLTLLLAILFNLLAQTSSDGVKHKKVIIKVPKKINHVHHHHVKKVHIWKHKPKPIHSVHIVEEDEHKPEIHGKKHIKFSEWKEEKPVHEYEGWEEEEEDEEYGDFHEDDTHKKSGSHYEPVIWKGGKGSRVKGSGGKKYRESSAIVAGRGRGKPRGNGGNYKGERAKRQKNQGHHEDSYQEESRYKRRPQVPPKGKKPKKINKGKGPYERRPKPKPYRPIEKGYADYGDYDEYNQDSVWPERKEHISWHQRPVTEEQYFYQGEYKGEIDLSKKPDIPIVPPPNLVPKYNVPSEQDVQYQPPESPAPPPVEYRKPQPVEYRKPQPVEYRKPATLKPKPQHRKPAPVEYRKPPAESILDGFHQLDQHQEGTLAGYSSHVGHNSDGDSASFQSVRFGEKKPSHHH